MTRPLRLEHPGALWHVTSRGNEQREIFLDDQDRRDWQAVLKQSVELAAWRVHAYVLMGNHYHVVIETPEPTLSAGMRQLNGVYTRHFNRRHRRVGHLFQGRFHSVLVERESHLLELLRYVVLNPVRAGLARSAGEWIWSSYRATAGLMVGPDWLETSWTRQQFPSLARYREFVAEGACRPVDLWRDLRSQVYLGSEAFVLAHTRRAEQSTQAPEIPRPQREPPRVAANRLLPCLLSSLEVGLHELTGNRRKRQRERALLAYALRRYAGVTGAEVGEILEVSSWHASALARAGEADCQSHVASLSRLENAVRAAQIPHNRPRTKL